MLDRGFTCVRLSHPYLTWSIHAFDHNVHHRGHCAAAACGSLKPLPAERLRGTFPHLSCSFTPPFGWCIRGTRSGAVCRYVALSLVLGLSFGIVDCRIGPSWDSDSSSTGRTKSCC